MKHEYMEQEQGKLMKIDFPVDLSALGESNSEATQEMDMIFF
jgi:hypothetical protein